MELGKLSVEYIDGFVGIPKPDGFIQKDKVLPYITIVYPQSGCYDIQVEDGPFQHLEEQAGCYITAPFLRHTIVHRTAPGQPFMQPLWLRLSVLYNGVLDVTGWFQPPLFVKGEDAQPFIDAIRELCTIRDPSVTYDRPYSGKQTWDKAFQKLRITGSVLENLLRISDFQAVDPETERIYPALARIGSHYGQHLSVEQLARECGMSVSTFYRVFSRIMSKSPMQYLNEYRLKQAAQMLMREGAVLSDIAERCGFCDEFHLSRNFKTYYNLSPREYKKRSL